MRKLHCSFGCEICNRLWDTLGKSMESEVFAQGDSKGSDQVDAREYCERLGFIPNLKIRKAIRAYNRKTETLKQISIHRKMHHPDTPIFVECMGKWNENTFLGIRELLEERLKARVKKLGNIAHVQPGETDEEAFGQYARSKFRQSNHWLNPINRTAAGII